MLKLGNISLDGSKIHADASKSKAVSYKYLTKLETQLHKEVNELFELGEQADQGDLQLVVPSLSNHPNDKKEAEPTLDAISPIVGKPKAAALDNGYFNETNIAAIEKRGIDPYIATGREPHHKSWRTFCEQMPDPPLEDTSPKVKMAFKFQTEIGKAIYRLRKCTVELINGIIKEVMGFRQFSLRGLTAAAGEWCLVCLAFNLKRMHILMIG